MMIISLIPPSFAQNSNTKLTLEFLHSNYEVGETIIFKGKLSDYGGVGIRFATIWVVEDDGTSNDPIISGTTDARGEYKIKLAAKYWDGSSDPKVEFFTWYSGGGSYKSAMSNKKEFNVNPPRKDYSSSSSSSSEYSNTGISTKKSTKLTLRARDGIAEGSVQLLPTLKTATGQTLLSTNIQISANGKIIELISAKQWSHDINLGIGSHKITAQYFPKQTSPYITSSGTIDYVIVSKPSYHNTFLSLQVQDSTFQEYIKVKPTLTYGSGTKLATKDISIYVDGNYKGKVTANQLSSSIHAGSGHHTIKASFTEMPNALDNTIRYRASSDTVNNYFVKAATIASPTGPPSSGSSSGVSSSDSFPIGYVIVGVAIAAAAAGVGIALSKRRKVVPVMLASPANIPVAPATDDTQFWVCPNCGKDTQYKNGKQYCDSCKVYL